MINCFMSELRREERWRELEAKGYDTPWWFWAVCFTALFFAGVGIGMGIGSSAWAELGEVPPVVTYEVTE